MKSYRQIPLALLMIGLVGSVALDGGPLASNAIAQRSNDNDDGGSSRSREEGGFRGRGGRDIGGDGGGFRGRGGRGFGGFRREGGEFRGRGGEESGERSRRREDGDDDSERDRGRSRDSSSSMDTTEYARGLIRRYDKNNNMMLEGDELRELRGPAAGADANDDKTITLDELVARLSSRGGSGGGDGERPRRSSGSDRGSNSATGTTGAASAKQREYFGSVSGVRAGDKPPTDKRRTYRFLPPAERLPTGLPSWFKSNDRNDDGQVEMSEYSRIWSASQVNRFRNLDLNNDGIITAKEAVK